MRETDTTSLYYTCYSQRLLCSAWQALSQLELALELLLGMPSLLEQVEQVVLVVLLHRRPRARGGGGGLLLAHTTHRRDTV